MITKNICRFIPTHKDYGSVQIINFILETETQTPDIIRTRSTYIMHFVTEGEGILYTCGKAYQLSRGDIFFVFPGNPYQLESVNDFKYIYISYIGLRANVIMDKLKITSANCVFHGFENLYDMWNEALTISHDILELRSESILLYTFSSISTRISDGNNTDNNSTTPSLIKKYIDEHISDPELSLKKISSELSYNQKYISMIFKEKFKIGISGYITTARIQNACTLMEQGFTSVKDIAFLCGYKDQLYFSKVFKSKLKISPKKYISELHDN